MHIYLCRRVVFKSFFYCSCVLTLELRNKAAVRPHTHYFHSFLSLLLPRFNQWNLRTVYVRTLVPMELFLPRNSQTMSFNTLCINCSFKAHNDFSKCLRIPWSTSLFFQVKLTRIIIAPKENLWSKYIIKSSIVEMNFREVIECYSMTFIQISEGIIECIISSEPCAFCLLKLHRWLMDRRKCGL